MRNWRIIAASAPLLLFLPRLAQASATLDDTLYGHTMEPNIALLAALLALLLEGAILWYLFHHDVHPKRILASFVFINLIVFPLTWVISLAAGPFAEIVPLAAKPAMYALYFKRIQVSPSNVWGKIIFANSACFLLVFVAFASVQNFL